MQTYLLNSANIELAEQIELAAYYEAIIFLRSNMSKYLEADQVLGVALERTVPRTVLFDAISIWSDRVPYAKPDNATELPYGYWADLLVFPLREQDGIQEAMFSKKWFFCVSIPLLTVERRVLGIIGEKHMVSYCDLKEKLAECLVDIKEELSSDQQYAYEKIDVDRYSAVCRILRGNDSQIKNTNHPNRLVGAEHESAKKKSLKKMEGA